MSKPKGMLKRNEFMRLGFAAFILVASAHVYQLVVELSSLRRAAELAILTSPFFAWLQISFILAFVITAITLLANRTLGRVGALIGLSIVLLNYAVWCAFSSRSLQVIGRDNFYQEYPEYMPQFILGLVRAHWWNFPALILTFVFLAYLLCEPWVRR